MPSTWNEDYKNIRDEFAQAETKIKQIEHVTGRLKTPSINELRYVAKHLLDAIEEDVGSARYNRLISEILSHCHRAIYDAMEIGILYYEKQIRLFKQDYRKVQITDVIKDYPKHLVSVNTTIVNIAETINRNSDSEAELVQKRDDIQKQFEQVETIAREFEAARPELNKLVRKRRQTTLIVCTTVSGLVVAILTLAYMIISTQSAQ